jgi:8-oxo-dGTP diphosphatase
MDLSGRQLFAVTADLAVFAFGPDGLRLLLVQRARPPFTGHWALPAGFMEAGETLEACAARELREESGLELRRLEPFGVYSAPDRDPRGPVVTVAHLALVRRAGLAPRAGSDAAAVAWNDVSDLPPLAFDHGRIVADARARLAARLYSSLEAFDLLPDSFTLGEAQAAYQAITGGPLDKRNFRAWLQREVPLRQTGAARRGAHRPAKLYTVDRGKTPDEPAG